MTHDREAISRRIRALRAKTVENGCTEQEAIAAAQMLSDLLAKYNMTLDEAEMRASPFTHHRESHDDWVGERLGRIAAAVSDLTGARYWVQRPGEKPSIDFFGFAHEVEVARYMLEVCASAMRREQTKRVNPLRALRRQRTYVLPFLDGMADRLAKRIREMIPPKPTGTGLVVLHGALVEQAMADAGHKLKDRRARASRSLEPAYVDGIRAGDRVALNQSLRGSPADTIALESM